MNCIFFSGSSDSPADLLNNAAAVCRFLQDVAPALCDDGRQVGLSETGAMGLICILDGIEQTIQAAVGRL
jgi:hypothetical protein